MSDKEAQPDVRINPGRFLSRKGRMILGISTVTGLCIALLIFGIRIISGSPERPPTNKRSERMFITKQKATAGRELQPVGMSHHAQTQIATFALG